MATLQELRTKPSTRIATRTPTKRNAKLHVVKCWPEFFEAIRTRAKTHDLRRYDERDYRVGDTLELQEFLPEAGQYTGRSVRVLITYITSTDSPCAFSKAGLDPRLCILSIRLTTAKQK
jgi:Domain of unknown function (DUF3850)